MIHVFARRYGNPEHKRHLSIDGRSLLCSRNTRYLVKLFTLPDNAWFTEGWEYCSTCIRTLERLRRKGKLDNAGA